MVLLKFKPDPPPPVSRPSLEQLSHLIKTCLHYPESYDHPFPQKRYTYVHTHTFLGTIQSWRFFIIFDKRINLINQNNIHVSGIRMFIDVTVSFPGGAVNVVVCSWPLTGK